MNAHVSGCLEGPFNKSHDWWLTEGTETEVGGIRTALVERVRREIAAGTYDTPEKFEMALDRLLDRLGGSEAEKK
jgi:hypothetical protein